MMPSSRCCTRIVCNPEVAKYTGPASVPYPPSFQPQPDTPAPLPSSRTIAEALDGPTKLYISVDIDVLDPAFAPGTGTPEPGGLNTRELLLALRRMTQALDVVGMDVVEVSPPYDWAELTATAANRCIMEAITGIAMRRRAAAGSEG